MAVAARVAAYATAQSALATADDVAAGAMRRIGWDSGSSLLPGGHVRQKTSGCCQRCGKLRMLKTSRRKPWRPMPSA